MDRDRTKNVSAQAVQITTLPIASIRRDGGTQSRVGLDSANVRHLADVLLFGSELPPVDVYHDGSAYWLADGFHRIAAYSDAGRDSAPATVHQGTRRDAILHSVGANATHGLRRSNEDKRRAVGVLLHDAEWAQWSDRRIAEVCGVSDPFVGKLRAELQTVSSSSPATDTRKGADGKVRRVPAPKQLHEPPVQPGPDDLAVDDDPEEDAPDDVSTELPAEDDAEEDPELVPAAAAPVAIPRDGGMSDLDVTIACVRGLNDEERAELYRNLGVVAFGALVSLIEQRGRDPEYAQMRRISEPPPNATRGMRQVTAVLDGADVALAMLGCTWASTAEEIRRAYRESSLAAHPDRGGDPEVMAKLNWAHGVVRSFVEVKS